MTVLRKVSIFEKFNLECNNTGYIFLHNASNFYLYHSPKNHLFIENVGRQKRIKHCTRKISREEFGTEVKIILNMKLQICCKDFNWFNVGFHSECVIE